MELAFSFTECAPIPQEPQLVIPAAETVGGVAFTVRNTGKSAYRYLERAGRRFRGWLTVTATAVILNAVRVFHRIFSKTAACCFNRRTWVRQGRLRL